MSKVSFCFSNNSEVSRISLWVWWVSLFSFQFFTAFNNWFLIRRHISLSGLDLSRIQHLPAPINLHSALWLICASCIICPVMFNSARVEIIKKITCIWRQWGENIGYFEKKWPLLKTCHEVLAVENHMAIIFFAIFYGCVEEWKYVVSCALLKQSEQELRFLLPFTALDSLWGLGGFVAPGSLPHVHLRSLGFVFLYFLLWL